MGMHAAAAAVLLQLIMSRLLDVGSAVATPTDSSSQHKLARVQFPKEATVQLEVGAALRKGVKGAL
jgi:hypothetical protein